MSLVPSIAARPLRALAVAAALVAGPAAVVVVQSAPAGAATYTVDDTTDGAPVASDCTTPVPGSCSLRDAVAAASSGGPHTISLAAGTTYQLTYCADATGRALRLNTNSTVTLEGNGATIEQTCALDDANGVIANQGTGTLQIFDVTLTGANSTEGSGAIQAGNDANTILVDGVTITGNSAAFQAAIGTAGPLTVRNSTITGNTSTVAADNGVVRTFNDGMVIENSTITGNTGGGIESAEGGLTLVYSTVAGNTSTTGAGGFSNINVPASSFISFGSVVTDPLGGGVNCNTTATSQGYNYESDGDTCGFVTATDVADGADPELGVLADNGGTTETMLPAITSPLLGRIPAANCQDGAAAGITTDQRGVTRPQGNGCDVGAVEIAEPAPPVPPEPPTPPTPPVDPVVIAPRFAG